MHLAAANWFEEVKEKKERRETGVKTRDKSFKMKRGEKEMLNATTFHLGPPLFFCCCSFIRRSGVSFKQLGLPLHNSSRLLLTTGCCLLTQFSWEHRAGPCVPHTNRRAKAKAAQLCVWAHNDRNVLKWLKLSFHLPACLSDNLLCGVNRLREQLINCQAALLCECVWPLVWSLLKLMSKQREKWEGGDGEVERGERWGWN